MKEDSGSSSSSSSSQVISIQNQLEALRDTERGLVAHNCYLKMKKARLNLSLVTIMVNISSTVTLQCGIISKFIVLQRGLLAPDEIKDVDVRAVKKKVIYLF